MYLVKKDSSTGDSLNETNKVTVKNIVSRDWSKSAGGFSVCKN